MLQPGDVRWCALPQWHALTILAVAVIALGPCVKGQTPSAATVDRSPSQPLTKVEEIRNLSRAEAARGYSVKIRAVVTFSDLDREILFLQDSTGGIFVSLAKRDDLNLEAGDLVEVEGVTAIPDFAPNIGEARVRVLGKSPLPKPIRLSYEDLISSDVDSKWVEVEGIARTLEVTGVSKYARQFWEQEISTPQFHTANHTTLVRLIVAVGPSRIPIYVKHSGLIQPDRFVDAKVRVRGVRASFFNKKNQQIGIDVFVPGFDQVQIVAPPPSSVFAFT